MKSSDSQIDKPQRGRVAGCKYKHRRINTERASLNVRSNAESEQFDHRPHRYHIAILIPHKSLKLHYFDCEFIFKVS